MKKILTVSAIILLLGAGVSIAVLTGKCKAQAAQIETLTAQAAQQTQVIERLGALDAVSCNVSFVVNNKAVFGSIKNGDYKPILEGTMRYLRSEIVQSDTLIVSKNLKK